MIGNCAEKHIYIVHVIGERRHLGLLKNVFVLFLKVACLVLGHCTALVLDEITLGAY